MLNFLNLLRLYLSSHPQNNKKIFQMDAEILNQENDGIFIEIHDNNNNPNLLFEISILYDQYLELEDLLRILPKTWIELEKQRKLKLKIESVFVPTYEFVLKSGESYELRMIE